MRFERVRSGLAETVHDVDVIAVDANGRDLFASGDPDRVFFHRSAIKPFQALAGQRLGLRLPNEHLAVACSSHGGHPVHIAIVRDMLRRHDRDPADLRTPPAWPLAPGARDALVARGHSEPLPIFHNCSGKHAGWLAACSVADLDPGTYTDPEHPLQRSIADIVADVTGGDVAPTGIDGCGAPTMRGTVRGLARAFARLSIDPEMATIATAMSSYGALVADNVRGDGRFAANWGGPSKVGAEGVFAASRHGVGIAAKARDGVEGVAVAAVLAAADHLGMVPNGTSAWLDDVARPPVFGGTDRVGTLEPVRS